MRGARLSHEETRRDRSVDCGCGIKEVHIDKALVGGVVVFLIDRARVRAGLMLFFALILALSLMLILMW